MTTTPRPKKLPDPYCGAVYGRGNQPITCRLDKGHKGPHSDERPSERAMRESARPDDTTDTAIGTVRPPALQLARALPAVHRVKSWPEQFRAVITGRKRFE